MKKISSGKVREIYEVDDDKLMLVVSDRISAFDYILPAMIPNKGKPNICFLVRLCKRYCSKSCYFNRY